MSNIWNPKGFITGNVVDARDNIFVFRFKEKKDKLRVIDGQPWHFDKFIWCFNEPIADGKLVEIPLYNLLLWAEIYDLPLMGRNNEGNIRKPGTQLCQFVCADQTLLPELERGIRIRVMREVRKLLKNSICSRMRDGRIIEFDVKYERLPTFCYGCGVLGHGEKNYEDGPFANEDL
ncbi:uncharacterized protein LOC141648921 [Silene latifolia]|uniref:uncharacterized protein LOC141648921 n=1 Tax=Silene latifolia TaxID=37657 RepID=UPI003D7713E3